MSKVATGLATGKMATPALAAQAVSRAIEKGNIKTPTAVLLFLTSEFACNPEPAIKAAAKAAGCTQVVGCSAPGIFTEEDWVLDSPAAAAMVFSDNATLSVLDKDAAPFLLTLAAPNAVNNTWLNQPILRLGGISGDATGQGSFSVWQSGKGAQQGYCEVAIQHASSAFQASHGLKIISEPKQVTNVKHHQLLSIDDTDAISSLTNAWQKQDKCHQDIPYHQLVALYSTHQSAITEEDDYHTATIIASDESTGTVTLSQSLQVGDWLSWGLRDANTAQVDIVKTASKLRLALMAEPSFAMLFSCLGRGPSFYNGSDQDLELVKTLFPALPIIGFYGNGEIAPISNKSEILQYAAVLGLFSEEIKR
jgi:small ligand-binding sensory domain FIST